MALAEGDRYMGTLTDFSEKPRFRLFNFGQNNQKTVKLQNGERIPIVKDINAFTAEIVVKEMEKERLERGQGQQPATEQRRPLTRIKNMVTSFAGGVIK